MSRKNVEHPQIRNSEMCLFNKHHPRTPSSSSPSKDETCQRVGVYLCPRPQSISNDIPRLVHTVTGNRKSQKTLLQITGRNRLEISTRTWIPVGWVSFSSSSSVALLDLPAWNHLSSTSKVSSRNTTPRCYHTSGRRHRGFRTWLRIHWWLEWQLQRPASLRKLNWQITRNSTGIFPTVMWSQPINQ